MNKLQELTEAIEEYFEDSTTIDLSENANNFAGDMENAGFINFYLTSQHEADGFGSWVEVSVGITLPNDRYGALIFDYNFPCVWETALQLAEKLLETEREAEKLEESVSFNK